MVEPLWWTFHDLTVDNVLDFTDKELKIRLRDSEFYKSFEFGEKILVWNAIHNAQSDRQDTRHEEQMSFWIKHGFKCDWPLRISQIFWDTSIEMLLLLSNEQITLLLEKSDTVLPQDKERHVYASIHEACVEQGLRPGPNITTHTYGFDPQDPNDARLRQEEIDVEKEEDQKTLWAKHDFIKGTQQKLWVAFKYMSVDDILKL